MDPSDESHFNEPSVHNFECNWMPDRRRRKIADRFYDCTGIQIYIHHTEGLVPENHVRVAYLI
jgi:hypothetical protein